MKDDPRRIHIRPIEGKVLVACIFGSSNINIFKHRYAGHPRFLCPSMLVLQDCEGSVHEIAKSLFAPDEDVCDRRSSDEVRNSRRRVARGYGKAYIAAANDAHSEGKVRDCIYNTHNWASECIACRRIALRF